ncbi:hypothetical protein A0H81_10092 [Grifola frondosa]|uniref:Uncharacterized protein n=1 Tax=Grifola frondosa TaxID=5627 RepID=A0A1C7M3C8_GRIFR|nr:hypothetical protein A0H81_10092 [Grifola frondosa]
MDAYYGILVGTTPGSSGQKREKRRRKYIYACRRKCGTRCFFMCTVALQIRRSNHALAAWKGAVRPYVHSNDNVHAISCVGLIITRTLLHQRKKRASTKDRTPQLLFNLSLTSTPISYLCATVLNITVPIATAVQITTHPPVVILLNKDILSKSPNVVLMFSYILSVLRGVLYVAPHPTCTSLVWEPPTHTIHPPVLPIPLGVARHDYPLPQFWTADAAFVIAIVLFFATMSLSFIVVLVVFPEPIVGTSSGDLIMCGEALEKDFDMTMSPLSEGPDTDATESQLSSASTMSTDMRISSHFVLLVSETARNTHGVVCRAVNINATDVPYSQLSPSSTAMEIWSGSFETPGFNAGELATCVEDIDADATDHSFSVALDENEQTSLPPASRIVNAEPDATRTSLPVCDDVAPQHDDLIADFEISTEPSLSGFELTDADFLSVYPLLKQYSHIHSCGIKVNVKRDRLLVTARVLAWFGTRWHFCDLGLELVAENQHFQNCIKFSPSNKIGIIVRAQMYRVIAKDAKDYKIEDFGKPVSTGEVDWKDFHPWGKFTCREILHEALPKKSDHQDIRGFEQIPSDNVADILAGFTPRTHYENGNLATNSSERATPARAHVESATPTQHAGLDSRVPPPSRTAADAVHWTPQAMPSLSQFGTVLASNGGPVNLQPTPSSFSASPSSPFSFRNSPAGSSSNQNPATPRPTPSSSSPFQFGSPPSAPPSSSRGPAASDLPSDPSSRFTFNFTAPAHETGSSGPTPTSPPRVPSPSFTFSAAPARETDSSRQIPRGFVFSAGSASSSSESPRQPSTPLRFGSSAAGASEFNFSATPRTQQFTFGA